MKLHISSMSYRDYDHFEMHCEGTDLEEVEKVTAYLHGFVTRGRRQRLLQTRDEVKWTEVGSYIDRVAPETQTGEDFDREEPRHAGYFRTSTTDQE